MSSTQWWLLGVAAVLLFWMVGAHNRVVALRNAIVTAWASCDELLRQRAEALAPALAALRPLMAAEGAAIDAVAQALAQVSQQAEALRPRPARAHAVAELAVAETTLAGALARLLALVEHEAAARATPEVAQALQALKDLAPRLAFARQAFNEAGRQYNEAVAQFPTSLLQPVFRFDAAGQL